MGFAMIAVQNFAKKAFDQIISSETAQIPNLMQLMVIKRR
jgi:hypothetical protein